MSLKNRPILVDREDYVGKIKINRPQSMNALNEEALDQFKESLKDFKQNQVRSLIVTGAGKKAFCAGVDLKEMPLSPEQDLADYASALGKFQAITKGLRGLEIPVIAAVNGYALGAGCDITLACDFRIASENAVFGETFIDVGFIPGDGGAYFLPRIVGETIAKEMIFTGKKVEAKEAKEIGLVERVTSPEDLLDITMEKAEALASGPTVAIGRAKKLVNESYDVDLDIAFEHATFAQRICSQTDDHKEAVEAFREDREPEFEGR